MIYYLTVRSKWKLVSSSDEIALDLPLF